MKVVNEDGSLVPWLQQAEDRGLITDGEIHLDPETYQMFIDWEAEQKQTKHTLH